MHKLSLPVTVAVGLSGSRDLCTIEDLLDFLDEWPPARRGPIREEVRRMCLAVYASEASSDDARDAFVAYARLLNVLEATFDPVPGHDLTAADRAHRKLHKAPVHGGSRAGVGSRR
ncbi:DUF982 domain-containing protein [Aerobium aerolatum]|uniref:DUF982 domain-containing protein n=1 Tax=Aquamicrobium aerolatum DSM 21857 TaxID=1121003 RepID=A0A1I3M694_9HYPH|nr:DUF982 domain-containing protein [Aquamicrobium aerolatum]SFI92569.1 Protein of unknown function [Aquamicrobium aerolatum DSM 21857]